MKRTIIALCLFGLAAAANATPWFTQDPRTLKQGMWRVEEHILYSSVDNSLSDGNEVPFGAGGEFTNFILHTRVRYGIRDDLTVFVDAPWVNKRWTQSSGTVATDNGLGDMLFLLKYKYHDNRADKTRRAFALSLKPHTGDYVGLPGPLAQGTGTTDWTLFHLWEKGVGKATWYASLGYSLTGSRSDTGRNPGDAILFNLAAEHKLSPEMNFVWEINGRYEGNTSGGALPVPASGATTIALTPGLQYTKTRTGGRFTTLEAGVQLPVITEGNLAAIPDYTIYAGGYTVF